MTINNKQVQRLTVNSSGDIYESENGHLVDYDDYAALQAENARLTAEKSEALISQAIEVEKMLCAALGRDWAPSGFSVESLVTECAELRKDKQRIERELIVDRVGEPHVELDASSAEAMLDTLRQCAQVAEVLGFVPTMTQRPRQPLKMGNYETVVEVRPARKRAKDQS